MWWSESFPFKCANEGSSHPSLTAYDMHFLPQNLKRQGYFRMQDAPKRSVQPRPGMRSATWHTSKDDCPVMGMWITNWSLVRGFVSTLEIRYIANYATLRQGYESFPIIPVR